MHNSPDIVDIVLYFLGALSVLTWATLIVKSFLFWRLKKANLEVTKVFLDNPKLSTVVNKKSNGTLGALAFRAISDLQKIARSTSQNLSIDFNHFAENLRQSLREERHRQQVRLESGLTILASIGSVSPFIGLFGTVWGIMHALKSITATGSAGLDVVAGPIGEALIATAIGIATAIPAVLAYNYFLRQTRLAAAEMEHFSERFQLIAKHSDYKVD